MAALEELSVEGFGEARSSAEPRLGWSVMAVVVSVNVARQRNI